MRCDTCGADLISATAWDKDSRFGPYLAFDESDAAEGQALKNVTWDARWLDTSKNPNQMSAKLRDGAIKIREAIDKIMRAGASGDF